MKKTQTITKTSFKGLINLQTQKLPQKKSRSRSIRDRNNTTSNQFSLSRATQHQQSLTIQHQNRTRQGTWTAGNTHQQFNPNKDNMIENRRKLSEQGMVKFDDNLSSNMSRDSGHELRNNNRGRYNDSRNNESRNQGSMQKIRQNMRKQSQQLKQKIRQRSQSRRKRKNSNSHNTHNAHSSQHSREAHPTQQQPQNEQQHQQLQEKQVLNQIINMKNRLQALQYHYATFGRQIGYEKNKENYEINGEQSIKIEVGEEEMREKAQDLNNILETFHITFKENVNKVQHDIHSRIDDWRNQHRSSNQQNSNSNPHSISMTNNQHDSIISIINRLQTQFCIQQAQSSKNPTTVNKQTISSSLFLSYVKEDKRPRFGDLEKKLMLAEERLLK